MYELVGIFMGGVLYAVGGIFLFVLGAAIYDLIQFTIKTRHH